MAVAEMLTTPLAWVLGFGVGVGLSIWLVARRLQGALSVWLSVPLWTVASIAVVGSMCAALIASAIPFRTLTYEWRSFQPKSQAYAFLEVRAMGGETRRGCRSDQSPVPLDWVEAVLTTNTGATSAFHVDLEDFSYYYQEPTGDVVSDIRVSGGIPEPEQSDLDDTPISLDELLELAERDQPTVDLGLDNPVPTIDIVPLDHNVLLDWMASVGCNRHNVLLAEEASELLAVLRATPNGGLLRTPTKALVEVNAASDANSWPPRWVAPASLLLWFGVWLLGLVLFAARRAASSPGTP